MLHAPGYRSTGQGRSLNPRKVTRGIVEVTRLIELGAELAATADVGVPQPTAYQWMELAKVSLESNENSLPTYSASTSTTKEMTVKVEITRAEQALVTALWMATLAHTVRLRESYTTEPTDDQKDEIAHRLEQTLLAEVVLLREEGPVITEQDLAEISHRHAEAVLLRVLGNPPHKPKLNLV